MSRTSARRSTSIEVHGRGRRGRASGRGLALALACACLLAAPAHAGGRGGSSNEARAAVVALSRQVDLLEKRLDLATSNDFYVVVDPEQSKLVLMIKGAVLREYPIQGLQVGAPRVAFRMRHLADDWQGRVWTRGELVPGRDRERIEIIPPDSTAVDSTRAFTPPPLPEELYPVPKRYRVRYDGGLSLEVRPQDLDESVGLFGRLSTGLHVWLRDLSTAIARSPEDTVRLRIVMQPEHAASLYRALPPSTRLLVLPRS